jgi:hypothetical protein
MLRIQAYEELKDRKAPGQKNPKALMKNDLQ